MTLIQAVPDYLRPGLKLVIVGINPGTRSGATGHHYAFAGNHFWPLMYDSGLIPEPLTYAEDYRVLEWDIGLTNLVHRTTATASDLTREELRCSVPELADKLSRFEPLVVAFNGKGIYEAYSGRRDVTLGLQPERLGNTQFFVTPSSSGRTAAYQRPAKLGYYRELKQLVDSAVGRQAL